MAQCLFTRGDRVTVTYDGDLSYALVVGWNHGLLMVVDHPLAGDVIEIDLDDADVEVELDRERDEDDERDGAHWVGMARRYGA